MIHALKTRQAAHGQKHSLLVGALPTLPIPASTLLHHLLALSHPLHQLLLPLQLALSLEQRLVNFPILKQINLQKVSSNNPSSSPSSTTSTPPTGTSAAGGSFLLVSFSRLNALIMYCCGD